MAIPPEEPGPTRVDNIIAQARALMNEASARFVTDAMILSWINLAQRRIANRGAFRKVATLDASAGAASIDLADESDGLADLVAIHQVRWVDSVEFMKAAPSWEHYLSVKIGESTISYESNPWLWYHIGTTLYTYPAPSAAASDAFEIYYSYMPSDMDNEEVDAPASLPVHDDYYAFYALAMAFQRDYTSQDSPRQANYWERKADDMGNAIISKSRPGVARLVPY